MTRCGLARACSPYVVVWGMRRKKTSQNLSRLYGACVAVWVSSRGDGSGAAARQRGGGIERDRVVPRWAPGKPVGAFGLVRTLVCQHWS